MNDDGYTLVEMLAALVIIGLAIGGLTQAVRVIGLTQGAAVRAMGEARQLRAAQEGLSRLAERQGPFASDQPAAASGTASGFSFGCGAAAACGVAVTSSGRGARIALTKPSGPVASIELAGASGANLIYGGDQSVGETWPPRSQQRQVLRWIGLTGGAGDAPLASGRLWREEAPDCVFDVIAQACRASAQ